MALYLSISSSKITETEVMMPNGADGIENQDNFGTNEISEGSEAEGESDQHDVDDSSKKLGPTAESQVEWKSSSPT